MKQKSLLTSLLLILGLGAYTALNTSYSSGFSGYTSSCGCHGGANAATTVAVNGLPTFYTPSAAYPITVTITNTMNNQAGFQVQTNIGTLTTTDADVTIQSGNMSAGHNKRKSMVSNTATFNLTWTAPATGGTAATFNAVGNAVNGSGTGGDMWNSAAATNVALPVNFTNVKAQKFADHVLVTFETEREENVNHFEIERSANGNDFKLLTTIYTIGSDSYSFKDIENSNETYYRIKEVSNDGEKFYSKIVRTSTSINTTTIKIYPTLIDQTIKISGVDFNSDLEFALFDLKGSKVFSSDITNNEISIPAILSGNYIATISSKNDILKFEKVFIK